MGGVIEVGGVNGVLGGVNRGERRRNNAHLVLLGNLGDLGWRRPLPVHHYHDDTGTEFA